MTNRLSEKVCVITGTGGGMGREAASGDMSRLSEKGGDDNGNSSGTAGRV